jgi:pimeloyl-ACP methyl ester carboxylesterase
MRTLKIAAAVVALFVVGALGVYGSMRAGWWATNLEDARARYAQAPSEFVTVDGVQLHVRDEGRGPVVVMLHGSIVNLHEWDLVADRLKGRYRIIRLDWPPYGLSSPDPKGVYSTPRAAELLAGLIDQLGLEKVTLVSTSNGANVALQYNAEHPEHVQAMAFSILPLERPSQTRKIGGLMKALVDFHKDWLPNYHGEIFYRQILRDTTPPGFDPPGFMTGSMHAANNLPWAVENQKQYIQANVKLFKTTDVGAIAAKVRVPVLLQWCAYDTVISQTAQKSVDRFTNTRVEVVNYPNLGHFPMLENPDLFSADLGRWLDRVTAPTSAVAP